MVLRQYLRQINKIYKELYRFMYGSYELEVRRYRLIKTHKRIY